MKNKPKISVIIPVYNTEKYLRTCLDSLIIQDCKDVEFILINDGSTDDSFNICREYQYRDARFIAVSKENGGPSSARNLGLSMAKGEYIAFVDSDDFVEPATYSKLCKLAEKECADIYVFGASLLPESSPKWLWDLVTTRDVVYTSFQPEIIFEEPGARPFLWLQMIKKNIITENNLKFDESMKLGEDQLFQTCCFPFAKKIVFTSEKFYNYRVFRENSLMSKFSSDINKKVEVHIDLIDKMFNVVFSKFDDENLRTVLFNWSIFLIWPDIIQLLAENQTNSALKLIKVWKKYNCEKLCDRLDIWGQSRCNQILLMGECGLNFDKKIDKYKKEIDRLENEICQLEKQPKLKKIIKKNKRKQNSLFGKFFKSLRKYGIKKTLKLVFLKITKKF